MKLAIMQPYFFPYIGYWQLISAVDTFVIYDDVNYVKKGYINRNQILVNNASHLITLELIGASQNKRINEIVVGGNLTKLLKTINLAYKRAPYFHETFPVLEDILMQKEDNLACFIGYSLLKVSEYLGIHTQFTYSSLIKKNNSLKAQDKIIEICKNLQATDYVNTIGGRSLYGRDVFKRNDLGLHFLKPAKIKYMQFKEEFVPNLSIIDILMFNNKEAIHSFLRN